MHYLASPTRFYFFTGKGGVGKTSIACATSIRLAGLGKRVLLVSTDPASNVGQVFGLQIGANITAVPSVPGLDALEIDPEEVAEAYRERTLAPVRALLPLKEIEAITEQLSGSCTTELASFNEFTKLLGADEATAAYDHIIFDTAPTGHTLRLLQLPGEWTSFLDEGLGDASCLGPMSGLDQQRHTYSDAVAALQNPQLSTVVLIARPHRASIGEAARTQHELDQIGIRARHLVINGVLGTVASGDGFALAIQARESSAIADGLGALAADTVVDQLALRAFNMVGAQALGSLLDDASAVSTELGVSSEPFPAPGLDALIDQLDHQGCGLVMTMGKGGVGKTTVAAAIAVALAERGHQVHLTTTDPASHLKITLAGDIPGLTVSSIDPDAATQTYRDKVMAARGAALDAAGRAALAEDLRSPCTAEIAVFQAFSRAVNQAKRQFVIMDTAPTGHTLLLLDATGSYHRDVVRHLGADAHLTTPMMRLQDPDYTKVIIVTLAETTPVLEAEALVADLRRAGIHPWAWVVNNALSSTGTTNPLLLARAALEAPLLARVAAQAPALAVVPTQLAEPAGRAELLNLSAPLALSAH